MGNVLAAFKLEIKIARFQQHLKQCTQGLTLEAIFIYNFCYRGLLKWGSTHVPSMNFKSGRFACWWGGYVAVSILQYRICDSSCHCCRFNPSSCCLSPFIHWWIPEGPGPATPPTPPPYLKVCTTAPSPYLKVWIGHCYLSYVAVSWPGHLSKFYPNMASLYTVFCAHNIIIVTITIPTQQVYRVMRS